MAPALLSFQTWYYGGTLLSARANQKDAVKESALFFCLQEKPVSSELEDTPCPSDDFLTYQHQSLHNVHKQKINKAKENLFCWLCSITPSMQMSDMRSQTVK